MALPEPAGSLESDLVLRGQLRDLDLPQLLSALKLGRQYLTLEVFDANGAQQGRVSVKSGHIIEASTAAHSGAEAVQELLSSREVSEFRVRLQPLAAASALDDLGSIAALTRAESPSRTRLLETGVRKTAPPPLPRPRQPQGRILEGSLEEFELAHVLRVLSTSRQQFELHVRDDESASVGVIEVKSGMVVAASTEKLNGVPAARELLAARSGRFVAIRRAEVFAQRQPLTSVQELLQPVAAAPEPEAIREDDELAVPIPVLDGKLGDLDVASILHVAGASRQYTTVHIIDDQRRPLGAIHLKGGHVVSAQAQDIKGVAAVRRLLHSPRDFSFLVQRYPHAPELTTSLGSTASVLQRAAALSEPSYTPVGISAPAPARVAAAANSSNWIAGALVGAGFVLLGGIGTAVVLRSPVLNATTSVSPSSDPLLSAPPPAATPEPPPPAKGAVAEAVEAPQTAAQPSRAAIASFQAGLRQLGYEPGPIDGVIGPRTSAAIKAFQYAEHLMADGNLSAPTRAVLLRRIGEP